MTKDNVTQTHTRGPLMSADGQTSSGRVLYAARGDNAGMVAVVKHLPKPDMIASACEDNARLLAAAYTSYDKHCGANAIKAAEDDLLGQALAALRDALAVHGDEYSWGTKARVILAKVREEK